MLEKDVSASHYSAFSKAPINKAARRRSTREPWPSLDVNDPAIDASQASPDALLERYHSPPLVERVMIGRVQQRQHLEGPQSHTSSVSNSNSILQG